MSPGVVALHVADRPLDHHALGEAVTVVPAEVEAERGLGELIAADLAKGALP